MNKTIAAAILASVLTSAAFAAEGPTPAGMPPLTHVFVIMMENHGFGQIINNPNAPYVNYLAETASLATNYFAIAHPSLTNYLEIVGGSNFGVHSDNTPDWHNFYCVTNLPPATPSTDNPTSPNICPIGGSGTDAETPAIDTTNETTRDHRVDIAISMARNPSRRRRTRSVRRSPISWWKQDRAGRVIRKACPSTAPTS